MISPKTILVTGAAGLIGSNFCNWLAVRYPEIRVVAVDDLSGGYRENLVHSIIFNRLDVGEKYGMKSLFDKYQPDVVYHFAAYAAEGLSPFIRQFNYDNNLVATANVVNNCIRTGVKRLVFTSSMAVYGHGKPPFSEEDLPVPADPYGVAKYACEMDIKIAGEQHGLDWCIIRPHNVYGINQNIWDVYRNVLGIWMYNLLNGLPITIYGDGLQTRAFSYIDDILECLYISGTAPECSKEIVNLGGINEVKIVDAANILKDVVGYGTIEHLAPRHEVKHAFSTWEKSHKLLNFYHKTTLEEGLKIMWDWAQLQPRRKRFVWESYELDRGLYPYWKQENIKK